MAPDPFSISKYFLECLAALSPKITNHIKIENLNAGGTHCHIQNGNFVQNGVAPIPISKSESGAGSATINNIPVEAASDNKEANVKSLDTDGKVFTRSDVGAAQLEYLSIEKAHEVIIQRLKPLIEKHKNGSDLGALLISCTMIRLEDSKATIEQCKKLHDKLRLSHGPRGLMIYNLFRSEILRTEVLRHLNNLRSAYKNQAELRLYFLTYWDTILEQGYPTAHFMKYEDSKGTLYHELEWRISKGISPFVYVYSRGFDRNERTLKWCEEFAEDKGYKCTVLRRYTLGHSAALKIRISHSHS